MQRNGSMNRLKINNDGLPVPYKSSGNDSPLNKNKVPSHLRRIG